MILRELTLRNFGVYSGETSIPLEPPAADKSVILVGGQNGEGKTTILEAVRLALYGPHSMRMNGRAGGYETYLRSRIHRRAPQEEGAAVGMEIHLPREGRMQVLRLTRSWRVASSGVAEVLEVLVDGEFSSQLSDGWADFIETVVPRGVAPLFFFDGERIEDLADLESASETLRTAVTALLGLELVDLLAGDLQALERRHAKKAASDQLQMALEEAEERVAAARKASETARQEVGELRSRCERARATLAKAEEMFARHGGETFEQRSELERRSEAARVQHHQAKDSLRRLAAGPLPLVLVARSLEQLRTEGDREQEAQIARALTTVLHDRDANLLDAVEMPAGVRSRVMNWLAADRERRSAEIQDIDSLDLSPDILAQIKALTAEHLGAARVEASEALAEVHRRALELEEAERRLAEVPTHDAVAKLLAEREKAAQKFQELEDRLQVATEELEAADRRLARAVEDHERVLRRVAEDELTAEESARLIDHSKKARRTLRLLRERAVAHHMRRIEGFISASLGLLMRKRGLVREVKIDPATFELQLLDAEHRPIPPRDLSAGERQLVALSLLWGLARAASRQLPVIIDTPLGRLDASHRELFVTKYLPNASHQTLVLSTDTEVDRSLLPLLRDSVGRMYRLKHDDDRGATVIEPGYFVSMEIPHTLAA